MTVRSVCGGFGHKGAKLTAVPLFRWLWALTVIAGMAGFTGNLLAAHAADPIRLEQERVIQFSPWDLVMAVAWMPDGRVLAASAGNHIVLVQADTWERIAEIRIGSLTHGLDFSPDGSWLAAGSRDGAVRLWDVKALLDGETSPVQVIQAHRKGANDVKFNPDGSLLVSAGNDAIARFWDPVDAASKGMAIGGTFAVPSVDFSPDGSVVAVVNGEVIRLRKTGSEQIVGTFQADAPLYHVTYNPAGDLLAAAGSDNLIRIWRSEEAFRTANPVYPEPRLLRGHQGEEGTFRALIWKTAFNPTGDLLASAGGDATIKIWEPISGQLLADYPAHKNGATCLAFRPDGRFLASGGLDGTLMIWSVKP